MVEPSQQHRRRGWRTRKRFWVLLCVCVLSVTSKSVYSGLMAAPISEQLGAVTLTEVAPRVVTPNGDMFNDVIYFKFGGDSLSGLPIESQILDINGGKVAGLNLNSNETSLIWDGKDSSGRSVPSGIYVYQIKIGDKQASGTVVVAH